jgi:hypothetical protein
LLACQEWIVFLLTDELSCSGSIPLTLADDAANELDHERDDLVIGKVLLPHEVIPGAEVKHMSQHSEQPLVKPALCAPSFGQSIAHPLQVDEVRLQNALYRRQIREITCYGTLTAGEAVLIPAMIPHGIRNVGTETARCVGFFGSATLVSTFDQILMPLGVRAAPTPPPAGAA